MGKGAGVWRVKMLSFSQQSKNYHHFARGDNEKDVEKKTRKEGGRRRGSSAPFLKASVCVAVCVSV